jgi:2-haloacid dehalogenase
VERWATFDCYGTLIDWDGGLLASLDGLFPGRGDDALVRFHAIEPTLQRDGARTYRQVLTDAVPAVAADLGAVVAASDAGVLAASVSSWPPFPEVNEALTTLRDRGWRIAILSNTDPDYLDGSLRLIGVPVDRRIVASEIGSYKPDAVHWEVFFRESGADRAGHVHVAASLFHDVEPCAALGLPCVWINRKTEISPVPRAAELSDLQGLPDLLDRLVPERSNV